MLTLNAPKCPAESYLPIVSGVLHINALELLPANERYSHGATSLNLLIVHRRTGEERQIDLLTPNDSFTTIQAIIQLHFPSRCWTFGESWTDEATELFQAPIAA